MDAERLADYLAGELDAAERAAVEAALDRDPRLRERLERLRSAERALADVRPAEPRAGFDERLRSALDEELAERLGGADDVRAAPERGAWAADDLAARRERRRTTSAGWPVAVGGVAAGLALLAAVGVGLAGLLGGTEDDMVATDLDVAEEEAMEAAPDDGPVVVVSGRDLGDDDADALAGEPVLARLRERGLDPEEGAALAEAWEGMIDAADAGVLAAPRADAPATLQEGAPEADAADEPAGSEEAAPAEQARPADPETREAIRRCLDTLLEGAPAAIPAYVEVASFEGEPAIVYALLTVGPQRDVYDRVEVWVVARDDCQVLQLRQPEG